jgi:hypothetical protein
METPGSAPAESTMIALTDGERDALLSAVRHRMQALLTEVAGTEKHELQRELAHDFDELENIARKLGGSE